MKVWTLVSILMVGGCGESIFSEMDPISPAADSGPTEAQDSGTVALMDAATDAASDEVDGGSEMDGGSQPDSGLAPDGGQELDASPETSPDAGAPDSGVDAGPSDAGVSDAGTDAGAFDAGVDAGEIDGGMDDALSLLGMAYVAACQTECASVETCAPGVINVAECESQCVMTDSRIATAVMDGSPEADAIGCLEALTADHDCVVTAGMTSCDALIDHFVRANPADFTCKSEEEASAAACLGF